MLSMVESINVGKGVSIGRLCYHMLKVKVMLS